MACLLLWNSTNHYLYRCVNRTDLNCIIIESELYICNEILKYSTTTNAYTQSTTKIPQGNTLATTTVFSNSDFATSTSSATLIAGTTTANRYQIPTTTSVPLSAVETSTKNTVKIETTTQSIWRNPPTTQTYVTTKINDLSTTTLLRGYTTQPTSHQIDLTPFYVLISCLILVICVLGVKIKNKKGTKPVLPSKKPQEDPEELERQLKVNAWRMRKLHDYLDKKYPEKVKLVDLAEENCNLMEKINLEIKNSPQRDIIYTKRKKNVKKIKSEEEKIEKAPPALVQDKIEKLPTEKIDFSTVVAEPEKIKHISSVAKLKIKMLPADYERRRKSKNNLEPLKSTLLPARPARPAPKPPVHKDIERLKKLKLVTSSKFT